MAGLVPAIHVFLSCCPRHGCAWMPGTRPRMTEALLLRKRRRRFFGQRHVEHVEHHRDHAVIAENAHELDRRGVTQNGMHAFVGALAHPPRLVELLDEIVDRSLVLRGLLRRTSCLEVADGLRRDPGLLGDRRVGVPLVLRAPLTRRAQDGELGEPWCDAGLVAAMGAELLREIAEFGRMQIDPERAALADAPARTSADRLHELLLAFRERVVGNRGQARFWLGGHAGCPWGLVGWAVVAAGLATDRWTSKHMAGQAPCAIFAASLEGAFCDARAACPDPSRAR